MVTMLRETPSKVDILIQSKLFGKLLAYVDLGYVIVFSGDKESTENLVNELNMYANAKVNEIMTFHTCKELNQLSRTGFQYFYNVDKIELDKANVYEVYTEGKNILDLIKRG